MKLTIEKRTGGKKGENKRLRRTGYIPAVLYGTGKETDMVRLKKEELQAVLRNLKPGLLSTTVFELSEEGHGKTQKAIVKEIQYHVATYEIQHVDFAILSENTPVTLHVPIQISGAADCVGVKLGGFLRQVIRTLKVSCLPRHIPQELTVDVRELQIAQSKTLADIAIPAEVKPLAKLTEVAVVVGKKAGT